MCGIILNYKVLHRESILCCVFLCTAKPFHAISLLMDVECDPPDIMSPPWLNSELVMGWMDKWANLSIPIRHVVMWSAVLIRAHKKKKTKLKNIQLQNDFPGSVTMLINSPPGRPGCPLISQTSHKSKAPRWWARPSELWNMRALEMSFFIHPVLNIRGI